MTMQTEQMTLGQLWNAATDAGFTFTLDPKTGRVFFAPPSIGDYTDRNSEAVAVALEIESRRDNFIWYAKYKLRLLAGNPVTEEELRRLPQPEREAVPAEVLFEVTRKRKFGNYSPSKVGSSWARTTALPKNRKTLARKLGSER
jgi:hypothetical protein